MNPMVDSLRSVPLFADFARRDLRRLADSMPERSSARVRDAQPAHQIPTAG